MKRLLSEKNIEAIEKSLNRSGAARVEVKVEHGQIVVLQLDAKKVG